MSVQPTLPSDLVKQNSVEQVEYSGHPSPRLHQNLTKSQGPFLPKFKQLDIAKAQYVTFKGSPKQANLKAAISDRSGKKAYKNQNNYDLQRENIKIGAVIGNVNILERNTFDQQTQVRKKKKYHPYDPQQMRNSIFSQPETKKKKSSSRSKSDHRKQQIKRSTNALNRAYITSSYSKIDAIIDKQHQSRQSMLLSDYMPEGSSRISIDDGFRKKDNRYISALRDTANASGALPSINPVSRGGTNSRAILSKSIISNDVLFSIQNGVDRQENYYFQGQDYNYPIEIKKRPKSKNKTSTYRLVPEKHEQTFGLPPNEQMPLANRYKKNKDNLLNLLKKQDLKKAKRMALNLEKIAKPITESGDYLSNERVTTSNDDFKPIEGTIQTDKKNRTLVEWNSVLQNFTISTSTGLDPVIKSEIRMANKKIKNSDQQIYVLNETYVKKQRSSRAETAIKFNSKVKSNADVKMDQATRFRQSQENITSFQNTLGKGLPNPKAQGRSQTNINHRMESLKKFNKTCLEPQKQEESPNLEDIININIPSTRRAKSKLISPTATSKKSRVISPDRALSPDVVSPGSKFLSPSSKKMGGNTQIRRKVNESYLSKLAEPKLKDRRPQMSPKFVTNKTPITAPNKTPITQPKKETEFKMPNKNVMSRQSLQQNLLSKSPRKVQFIEDEKKHTLNIAQQYEKKFGKTSKFVTENSPIDRYYKMYVVEPENKVFTSEKVTHFKGCPNGDKCDFPSPEKQQQLLKRIRGKSLEDIVQQVDIDKDAKSVLEHQYRLCDCHLRQKDMLARMLTKSPSIARSGGLGGSMYEEVMSKGSLLDQDLYFRKFRSPCRKTCSTTHNPMYHCSRWNQPMRPQSAECCKKKVEDALNSDWFEAGINEAVKELQAKEKMKELKQKMQLSGYNSENENSTSMFKLQPADQNYLELEDMKNLVEQFRARQEEAWGRGVLQEAEVSNYYKVMKTTPEQFSSDEIQSITTKSWLTLEYLMGSLNLKKEFEILFESHSKKQNKDDQIENEQLIKILIRCKKMYDCYQEIVHILIKVKKRTQLITQFQEEFNDASETRAKGYYFILLKLSTRIFNQVERLRIDFPMLNRPFIYNRENLQNALVRDGLNIRNNLIKKFKSLKPDLNRILDKSGKIIQLQVIIDLNKQQDTEGEEEQTPSHIDKTYRRLSRIEKVQSPIKSEGNTLL